MSILLGAGFDEVFPMSELKLFTFFSFVLMLLKIYISTYVYLVNAKLMHHHHQQQQQQQQQQ
jgi:hypothetical protein